MRRGMDGEPRFMAEPGGLKRGFTGAGFGCILEAVERWWVTP